ncbi:MAG TPA: hypothetical protein VJM09_01860 [Sphingobium sp.]|nr:hypothetical protein [Sphingobium sp.]
MKHAVLVPCPGAGRPALSSFPNANAIKLFFTMMGQFGEEMGESNFDETIFRRAVARLHFDCYPFTFLGSRPYQARLFSGAFTTASAGACRPANDATNRLTLHEA